METTEAPQNPTEEIQKPSEEVTIEEVRVAKPPKRERSELQKKQFDAARAKAVEMRKVHLHEGIGAEAPAARAAPMGADGQLADKALGLVSKVLQPSRHGRLARVFGLRGHAPC